MQRTAEQRAEHVQLLLGVAADDRQAFEALYDEFTDLVYSIAIGMLRDPQAAEDATQDVWVRVWNAAGGYDPAKASPATWITTIAHRHTIDLLRRRAVRSAEQPGAEPGDEVAGREAGSADTAGEAITGLLAEDVRTAMQELPDGQRRAIELAYFGGRTQSEIAEELGKPLGTVKTYVFQGMRRLRELLDTGDATEPPA